MILRAWAVWGCTYRVAAGLLVAYALYLVVVVGVSCYLWKIGYGASRERWDERGADRGVGSALPPVGGVCLAAVPGNVVPSLLCATFA